VSVNKIDDLTKTSDLLTYLRVEYTERKKIISILYYPGGTLRLKSFIRLDVDAGDVPSPQIPYFGGGTPTHLSDLKNIPPGLGLRGLSDETN